MIALPYRGAGPSRRASCVESGTLLDPSGYARDYVIPKTLQERKSIGRGHHLNGLQFTTECDMKMLVTKVARATSVLVDDGWLAMAIFALVLLAAILSS